MTLSIPRQQPRCVSHTGIDTGSFRYKPVLRTYLEGIHICQGTRYSRSNQDYQGRKSTTGHSVFESRMVTQTCFPDLLCARDSVGWHREREASNVAKRPFSSRDGLGGIHIVGQ